MRAQEYKRQSRTLTFVQSFRLLSPDPPHCTVQYQPEAEFYSFLGDSKARYDSPHPLSPKRREILPTKLNYRGHNKNIYQIIQTLPSICTVDRTNYLRARYCKNVLLKFQGYQYNSFTYFNFFCNVRYNSQITINAFLNKQLFY